MRFTVSAVSFVFFPMLKTVTKEEDEYKRNASIIFSAPKLLAATFLYIKNPPRFRNNS
jgi:hypothetical protein